MYVCLFSICQSVSVPNLLVCLSYTYIYYMYYIYALMELFLLVAFHCISSCFNYCFVSYCGK